MFVVLFNNPSIVRHCFLRYAISSLYLFTSATILHLSQYIPIIKSLGFFLTILITYLYWIINIIIKYDYIYIANVNDNFNTNYKFVFNNDVQNGQLYKIDKEILEGERDRLRDENLEKSKSTRSERDSYFGEESKKEVKEEKKEETEESNVDRIKNMY